MHLYRLFAESIAGWYPSELHPCFSIASVQFRRTKKNGAETYPRRNVVRCGGISIDRPVFHLCVGIHPYVVIVYRDRRGGVVMKNGKPDGTRGGQ